MFPLLNSQRLECTLIRSSCFCILSIPSPSFRARYFSPPLVGRPSPANHPHTTIPYTNMLTRAQKKSAALSSLTAGAATASSATAANSSSNAPSPTPALARVGGAGLEGDRTTSRAASANPETGPSFTMPSEAPAHGAPVRQYINQKVTSVLMQGMKLIAKEQPSDPLRVLGEFLLQRSKELEGPAAAAS
ncbi:hypothetical protein V8F06_002977 [Rhypophila decipiens]